MERARNSIKNIIMTIISRMSTLLLTFISRKVFLQELGSELLGVNGLFTNIVSVLSLTELGVSVVITYNLYKPLADKDYKRVTQLINYYKWLYAIIGCTVFILGILIFPFLDYLVNLENEIANIGLFYLLFLLDSVLSYFFIYRTAVMIADQKNYKLNIIMIVINICKMSLQIWVVAIHKSYILYLVIQLFLNVVGNFISSKYVEKKYPYIKEKTECRKEEKRIIISEVRDMCSYQFGGIILNNTDNILISVLVNTNTVGLYSTYAMIIQAISSTISMCFSSMNASIGNFLVKADKESKCHLFKTLNFMSFWICTIGSIGILTCIEGVIQLCFGKQYILGMDLLFVCVFNFFITGMNYPIWSFRNTIGLFKETKNIMLITALINLILSIILGNILGLTGVLLATSIARISTSMWYEPFILYNKYFQQSRRELMKYYIRIVSYFTEMIGIGIVTYAVIHSVKINSLMGNLCISMLFSILVPGIMIIVLHGKSKEFKELLYYTRKLLKKNIYEDSI